MYSINQIIFAFTLTLLSGLATGLGSLFVLKAKTTNVKFLSGALGFSAGVMIFVSFVEIYQEGAHALATFLGEKRGGWAIMLSFFAGIAVIALIDKLIPEGDNPHEVKSKEELETVHKVEELCEECIQSGKLKGCQNKEECRMCIHHELCEEVDEKANYDNLSRTGIFSAIAIAIHNFPEGIATFMGALTNPTLGISIAIAIAIHNIPEGISVAVPIYYATGSRKKAFWHAFTSGLAEPLGALLAGLILMPYINEGIMGVVFGMVAGIMVYISLDELLPTAEAYGEHHISIWGMVAGMLVMAVSLLLF